MAAMFGLKCLLPIVLIKSLLFIWRLFTCSCNSHAIINSLWPGDTIWLHGTLSTLVIWITWTSLSTVRERPLNFITHSTLVMVMTYCWMTPGHYLKFWNNEWHIIVNETFRNILQWCSVKDWNIFIQGNHLWKWFSAKWPPIFLTAVSYSDFN